MTPLIQLCSGANLNLLGDREPAIYGHHTLDDCVRTAQAECDVVGFRLRHIQSNAEADLVTAIQAAREDAAAVIINPGAFTHYSWAIHDALAAFDGPVVELHLSQPVTREPWRHTSVISPVAQALISGLGVDGYSLAVRAVSVLLRRDS